MTKNIDGNEDDFGNNLICTVFAGDQSNIGKTYLFPKYSHVA